MVCAPEMLGKYYRSTTALVPLAADATRLLTARRPACVAGKRRGSIFRGSAIYKRLWQSTQSRLRFYSKIG